MATDFNYGNKTINSGGPIKPSGKDMRGDPRTRVDCYADIATIPNPYVGLKITVKVDETNKNKMTDYIVKSLKANSAGIANTLIDEVVRYVDYLEVSSSGGGTSAGTGEGLTPEQAQQLQTAYEHSQAPHVQASDIPSKTSDLTNDSNYATETFVTSKIAEAQLGGDEVDLSAYATKAYADNAVSTALDGHTFKFLTQAEYDDLETKDPLVEYHITDATEPETIDTTSFATDLSLTGSSLQLKNSNGNLIGSAVKLPTTSGTPNVDLTDYPTRSEVLAKTNSTAFTPTSDYNPATKKYVDDSINSLSFEAGDISLTNYVIGCSLKLAEIKPVYGSLNLNTKSISGNEGTTATFTVKLNSAPNTTQTVNIACSHAYIYLSPQKLTFNPNNYNTAQTVTVSLLEDPTYTDWETSITVSSLGVSAQTINVSVTNTTKEPITITGISLNKPSLTLNEGASETLTATITPSDADTDYAWKSSAPNIATVKNGLITAVAEGSATITCYSVVNETIKAECNVTVAAVAIESITLPETATVNRNRTITLTPTIIPSGLTSYAWSIDNENASINNGVVTGITAGTSVVTCYSTRKPSIKDTTTVTIEELPITSITLDSTASVIQGKTVTLTPTITPSDATIGYSWSASNGNVSVENGVVTGVTVGTSVVTCYSNADDSIKAECTITINEKQVVNIDNIAIKDENLIAVFDARDGSNKEKTATLPNRIDNEDFAFNLSDFTYGTSHGFTDNNTIKFDYNNVASVSGANKIDITLSDSISNKDGRNNGIAYPNHTLMFAVKNVGIVNSNEQFPNTQFFLRSNSGYGVGLSLRPTGLYCNKAYAEQGSLITDDSTGNYHVVMCWDTSNSVIKIYINGEFKIDYPFSSTQNNGSFYKTVKFYNTVNGSKAYSAELEFFSAYNRILTADEVSQNYNAYMGV